jgi:ubiquinone/menaquinone biosynthesis C-methylase UbiE
VRSDLTRRGNRDMEAVAMDFSPTMLEAASKRFASIPRISVIAHNLDGPLPALGRFDAVISSFAIHHLVHERKRALYAEIFSCSIRAEFSAIWSTSLRRRNDCMKSFCTQ